MKHTFPICSDEALLRLKVPINRGCVQRVSESMYPLFSRNVTPGFFIASHIVLWVASTYVPHFIARTWSFGQLQPVYFTSQLPTCANNQAVIKVRHCVQSVIFLLCVPHHLAGVAFKASSIANILCCVGTLVSKFERKASRGFRPSKVGKLFIVVPMQQNYLVSRAHLLIDTSYIWFCQFSSASSQSDEHALSLRQLKFPSAVGLI
jgi:hypothetical protein